MQQTGEPRVLKLPPTPPKVIDVRMPGEAGWYLGVTGWLPSSSMVSEKGERDLQAALPACRIVFDRDSSMPNRRSK